MTKGIVFRSARIFDGESEVLRSGVNVFVEGGVIREISERPVGEEQEVVECGDRVLMPGLIDAHVHVYAAGLNIVRVVQSPMSYLAHFAAQFLHSSLDRGFTTLRDVGGADIGLFLAIRDGLLDRVHDCFTEAVSSRRRAVMGTSVRETTCLRRDTFADALITRTSWR